MMPLTDSAGSAAGLRAGALSALLCLVLLPGCVSVGEDFQLASVGRLRVGETTMDLARMELGIPLVEINVADWGKQRMHFGDEETVTIWRYNYASGTVGFARARFLQVDFDAAGKVSDYFYSSDFGDDEAGDSANKDFDLFQVRQSVFKGKTTKAEVSDLLGDTFRVIPINKPSVSERRHYGFSATLPSGAGRTIYGKSVDIDFDANGVVVDVRGESDFPADVNRSRH